MENTLMVQNAKALVIRKYRLQRLKIWLESLLLSGAMATFQAVMTTKIWPVLSSFSLIFIATFAGLLTVCFFIKKLYCSGLQEVVSFLDYQYPELEDSVSLLFKHTDELGKLARWQQVKVARLLLETKQKVRLPYRFISSVFFAVIFLLSAWLVQDSPQMTLEISKSKKPIYSETGSETFGNDVPAINGLSIRIDAPGYTRITTQLQSKPQIKAVQYSEAFWELSFSGSVERAVLLFNESDTLALLQNDKKYMAEKVLENPAYYRILWLTEAEEWQTTEFYPVEIVEDQPPVIQILDTEQYQKLKVEDNGLQFSARIRDDFGVKEAWIEATVSRGSGESVKFRELKLLFNEKLVGEKKNYLLTKMLAIDSLKMTPGDELYYKILARDNHRPQSLVSHSDTYILVLEDTAVQFMTNSKGMAVDLMPEYFRSQRQIIIDTEKLIAKRGKLSSTEFKQESNVLGADQKILRLRYGQFLGEEFESSIDEGTEHKAQMLQHKQEHEEGEENGEEPETLQAKAGTHDHDEHAEENGEKDFTFGVGGGMLTAMMHNHDPEGVSTFFDKQIRALLKAALAQMWEAELHLRLAAPEKALPYEYKALEIIKKVQQKSRVYVARLGFDPPPLKPAEKRLTGDLNEIKNFSAEFDIKNQSTFPAIRSAVPVLNDLITTGNELSSFQIERLKKAGQELASESLETGGGYLQSLSRVREVINGVENKQLRIFYLKQIRQTFIRILPVAPVEASQSVEFGESLDILYREELSK